jgi:hypothetical protein
MPHGGYHGTIVSGGNIIQQGVQDSQGNYQIQGGIGDAALNIPVDRPKTTTENIEKAIEDKQKQIQLLNAMQSGSGDTLGQFGFSLPVPQEGATGIDAINLAKQQNFQNELLNNLLKQQQEQQLRDQIVAQATGANLDPVDIEQGLISPFLRKSDFTGDAGDKTFLGINLGSTPTVAATTTNPYTGEKITTTKAREGLSSEDYAKFMAGLYDANPALMEQTFPVASGNLAQPILARLLEGGLGGVGSGIGSFIDSATGAIFKPRGGTVRPSDVGTPSDTGGVTSVIDASKANNNPFNLPSAFTGFYESDFYNPNAAGGQMVVPVTLPDGTVVRLPNTAVGEQFIQYLESIGVDSNLQDQTFKIVEDTPQPTGISNLM